ncbi:MAG TPA: HD domain-containing phosphohydrolase [Anaerolineaceae bacterium]|nr:HD domain-containing phosphohydrolase [Anaerolineaceae bacterium]HPN51943.1 HD domain-containing phosphohydrolase [Anaerolineaceae bacterium]
MPQPSDPEAEADHLRQKIIGLGETSIRKSYYGELQNRIAELERFRALLDQSTNLFFLIRVENGAIEDITRSVSVHLGYSRDELLGMLFCDLLDAEAGPACRKTVSLLKKESFLQIAGVKKADGEFIPMEFSFSPVDFDGIHYLIAVAQEISERIAAEQKIQKQLAHLTALHEIDLAINSQLNMQSILCIILRQITRSLDMDAACVLRFFPDGQIRYMAWDGFNGADLAVETPRHIQPEDCELSGLNRLVIITSPAELNAHFNSDQIRQQANFQVYFRYPLVVRNQVKGFLEIYNRQALEITAELCQYVESFAAQTAIAVEQHRILRDLQHSNQVLHEAYDETLEGWALALELREHETGQHTRRTQDLTLRLARAAGINGDELVRVRRGALLHDIGKMGIPDHILLKAGPLTPEEWQIMRLHPEYAVKFLSPIDFLKDCLDIPFCHHEKWDGSGYPRGLRGAEIPLAARLFAVVDVWDALLSDRVYRKAWKKDDVIQYIMAESGKHFDPDVVSLFLNSVVNVDNDSW